MLAVWPKPVFNTVKKVNMSKQVFINAGILDKRMLK